MIKLGYIHEVRAFRAQLIISIRVDSDNKARIGDTVRFERVGDIVVVGLKFWPDRGLLDLFVEGTDVRPLPGETVWLLEKQ